MNSVPMLARSSICTSCIRRLATEDLAQAWYPFHRQIRGKKKKAKSQTTIKVRLLADVRGYGRKGSITPVEPGRMRNSWYPRQKAEYVTVSNLNGVKPQNVAAERDFSFGMDTKETPVYQTMGTERDTVPHIQIRNLAPERATEIIEASLPSHIIFYRAPIAAPKPDIPALVRPRRAASLAASDLDAAFQPPSPSPKPQLTTIYGSVSTADIADSMKAILAETTDGARVVLGPEDVIIIPKHSMEDGLEETGIEGDRIKALGDFEVEARVKGGDAVVRIVSVMRQRAEDLEGEIGGEVPFQIYREV